MIFKNGSGSLKNKQNCILKMKNIPIEPESQKTYLTKKIKIGELYNRYKKSYSVRLRKENNKSKHTVYISYHKKEVTWRLNLF